MQIRFLDELEMQFICYPELSLRQPESTSLARATGFNKVQVNKFFNLLKQIISDSNIAPDKIFNMDETGMSTVQRSQKIIPDILPLPSAKLTQRRRKAKQATHVTGSPFKKSITTKVGGAAFKKLKYAKKCKPLTKQRKLTRKIMSVCFACSPMKNH